MRKDLYIQAMDAIPFSGDIEEQIYKRLQDEKQSYRKKMVFCTASAVCIAAVFSIICIFQKQTLYSNYLEKTELNKLESVNRIREFSVPAGSDISEEQILTSEMLILNINDSSDEKGVFMLQGEISGNDLMYDIGYISDGQYMELETSYTDTVLNTRVEFKENTEFSWCITNRSDNVMTFSGEVSVIYSDLFYRNYGEGVIDIDSISSILIHDIGSLIAEDEFNGIYLYNCKTRKTEKITAELENIDFQIDNPGKYIVYAMTHENKVINLVNFITVESIVNDQGMTGF